MKALGKKIVWAGIAVVGVAAGAAAITVQLIKPRLGDAEIDKRWQSFKRFRFAHRGLHDNAGPAPENSLEAFRRARLAGFGSELDVHLTADGKLAVVHDYNLKRVARETIEVEEHTLAEIESLRLFTSSESIPTLEQVVEAYEGFGTGEIPPLIVELKTTARNYTELTEKTLAVLDAHRVPYCIESFDPRPIAWLRRHRPDVIRGQLSQNWVKSGGNPGGPIAGFALTHLLTNVATRPDFIAYRYEDRDRLALKLAIQQLGGKLATWTIKSPTALYATEVMGGIPIFEHILPEA